MIQKTLSFLIIAFFLTVLILPLLSAQNIYHTPPRPSWLELQYKPTGVYQGVGWYRYNGSEPSLEEQEAAQKRALDNLCLKLSATVISEMSDVMSQRIKDGDSVTEEDVTSSLFVKTRQTLKGWEVKDVWTDLKKKIFWALVIIDKEEADRQVNEQKFINEVVDGLKYEINSILKEQKKIAETLNAQMEERLSEFLEKIKEEPAKRLNEIGDSSLPEPDQTGSTGLHEPIEVQ